MIIDLLKLNHFWNFRERGVQDTLWFQRQMLKKRYQDKKQDQLYNNQAKMNRPSVKIRLT
jgi:hypothetical protein